MADISKCTGKNCPIKETCYRFVAVNNEHRQSYFMGVPGKWMNDILNKKVWECEFYIKNKGK